LFEVEQQEGRAACKKSPEIVTALGTWPNLETQDKIGLKAVAELLDFMCCNLFVITEWMVVFRTGVH